MQGKSLALLTISARVLPITLSSIRVSSGPSLSNGLFLKHISFYSFNRIISKFDKGNNYNVLTCFFDDQNNGRLE